VLDPLKAAPRLAFMRLPKSAITAGVLLLPLLAGPARATGEGCYTPLEVDDSEQQLLTNAEATEAQLERHGYVYGDRALTAAVTRVGRLVSPKPTDPYLSYRFTVVRDIEPNAYTLPDGQVYVNTGLLALLDNEAMLAALLGHEVNHAAGHHGILSYRSARRKMTTGLVLGPLTLGVGDYFFVRSISGYSRDLEDEADARGVKAMVQAGYDPRQMVALFELLGTDRAGERPEMKPSKWSTHSELKARAEAVRAAIPGLTPGMKLDRLRVGEESAFRRLVRRAALDDANDLVGADFPRRAISLATRLAAEAPGDAMPRLILGDARRALGARANIEGEPAVVTDEEKRAALRRRASVTRDESRKVLQETPEGRLAIHTNNESALREYSRALEIDPGLAEAHRGKGYALEALGRRKEAGQEFVLYLRARPDAEDRPIVLEHLKGIRAGLKQGDVPVTGESHR
jgi:predicted Zn-dependent protease